MTETLSLILHLAINILAVLVGVKLGYRRCLGATNDTLRFLVSALPDDEEYADVRRQIADDGPGAGWVVRYMKLIRSLSRDEEGSFALEIYDTEEDDE